MEYHVHVCVYLLPTQTAYSSKPIFACLYPSIVFRAYTACTCTCMHSTCIVHVQYMCMLVLFLFYS